MKRRDSKIINLSLLQAKLKEIQALDSKVKHLVQDAFDTLHRVEIEVQLLREEIERRIK